MFVGNKGEFSIFIEDFGWLHITYPATSSRSWLREADDKLNV